MATEKAHGVESADDSVFSLTTTTRYNAAGQALSSTQKQLISQLSASLEGKMFSASERGLPSNRRVEFSIQLKNEIVF